MLEFLRKLFATDFMPHVYCLRIPEVIWLDVISDLLIGISYFAIPLALLSLIRRRKDLAFSGMFMLFGVFILACGTTHFLAVWTLWHPMYRLEGVVKAITALASMPTAVLLYRLLPQASALPSPSQLRAEINERKAAEERTRRLNADLERLVEERTAELKEMNARLRESESRFRAAAEAATNIIWTTDALGDFHGEQPQWAAFTGQSYEEYQEDGWSKKIHPDDVELTVRTWKRALSERTKFVFEHRVRRRDDEWRYCKVNAVAVMDGRGSVREWVGTHTDITEQRRAEQEAVLARTAAEKADRAKTSFLASMSHELRTPLNAIIGYSEMLEEQLQEAGHMPFVVDLQKVRSSGKHLLALINDLLDLRRIEAGRMAIDIEPIDVAALVKEVVEIASPLVRKSGNEFDVRTGPALGIMHSDPAKMRQSLLNLLSNAGKFTQHGAVRFEVEPNGNDVLFRVTDTGIGIAPDLLERVFEPFGQADVSIERLYGGTGLGLSLTRRYCRMMGGDVEVASSPREGSTFTIRLPRNYSDARAQLNEIRDAVPNPA